MLYHYQYGILHGYKFPSGKFIYFPFMKPLSKLPCNITTWSSGPWLILFHHCSALQSKGTYSAVSFDGPLHAHCCCCKENWLIQTWYKIGKILTTKQCSKGAKISRKVDLKIKNWFVYQKALAAGMILSEADSDKLRHQYHKRKSLLISALIKTCYLFWNSINHGNP